MIFTFPKDPNDAGDILFSKTKVDIKPGLTCIVGCNGSGKTTFLRLVKRQLDKKEIPYIHFDNYTQGHTTAMSELLFHDDLAGLAALAYHSEGEQIMGNIGRTVSKIGRAVRNAKNDSDLFILLDACDSGLSADQIVDLKDCFNLIIEDAAKRNVTVYILMVSNTYETVASREPTPTYSLDVSTFKLYRFDSYYQYRDFILYVSRPFKDARLKRQEESE